MRDRPAHARSRPDHDRGLGPGIAQGALDYVLGYVSERKQFGCVVAGFQGLRFMIAEMAMKLEVARQTDGGPPRR